MRLLFVHDHLGALGGAEANIHISASELRRRGHTIGFLHGPGTGKSEAAWRAAFDQCYELQPNRAGSIGAVLEQFKPDLLYLHKLAHLGAMEKLLDADVPVVRMVHDHDLYCLRSYKYNYFTRKVCTRPASAYCVFPCLGCVGRNRGGGFPLKWLSYRKKQKELRLNRRCRRLIAYSEYSRQELVRNGFERDRIALHVPIRCWGTDGPVSELSDRNLILFAGQIIRGKGVDLLLQALSKVKTAYECLIFGSGNHQAYCEQLCNRLGLSGKVHFRGFVAQEELRRHYLQASVFAMSSVWPEPFGMAGPEAMRFGLPVVAFDVGGIGEWLSHGENGFLVPVMDTEAFAARIDQLLLDKTLARRMGHSGLHRVNREYNAEQQVARLERLFTQVITEVERNALHSSPVSIALPVPT